MSKICQYCGNKLGFFEKTCGNCGATYEECSHCEETDSYQDSRYNRDPSEYASPYSAPMHNNPQHQANQNTYRPNYQQGFNNQYGNQYGSQYGNQYPNPYGNTRKAKKSNVAFPIVMCVIIFIIIGLIIFVKSIISLVNNSGYRGPLTDYFESINDADGKAYYNSILTSEMAYELYGLGTAEINAYYKAYSNYIEDLKEYLSEEFGDDITVSYKVNDNEQLQPGEIDELNERFDYISSMLNVQDGYEVNLSITIKGDDDKHTSKAYAQVLKINGKWVLFLLEGSFGGCFDVYCQLDAAIEQELALADAHAKDIYTAATTYAKFCRECGYQIPGGTVIGGEYISEGAIIGLYNTYDELFSIDEVPTEDEIIDGIYSCLPQGKTGMVYCIEFDDYGLPCAVICAEDMNSIFVGGYPNYANDVKIQLSDAKID